MRSVATGMDGVTETREVAESPSQRSWLERVDILVEGLCKLASSGDVVSAILKAAGCAENSVKVRCFFGRNARSVAFVSVPAAVASTLLKAGKIAVGWVIAKIVLPFRRRAICVRCCNPGYFGSSCPVHPKRLDETHERCFQEKRDTGHESARMLSVARLAQRPWWAVSRSTAEEGENSRF